MQKRSSRRPRIALFLALAYIIVGACVAPSTDRFEVQSWWHGLGPVLPHETFPADCTLCHVGTEWHVLVEDFSFDHELETGVALEGAHAQAQCLRCHNDRGPVDVFTRRGCAGCHEDIHIGQLGQNCTKCHQQNTWDPVGQIELHASTRFPLVGVHAATSCRRCHPGAEIGRFLPTDTECVTCHQSDLARANNPNHLALGWTNRCHRCHLPTNWNQAQLNE